MDLYADNILDHYRHPRGREPLLKPYIEHHEENVSCGDALTLQLKIDGGRIAALSWEGTGCAISQAAMSMLSEELAGMNMTDAERLESSHIRDLLGVPVGTRRIKCALLGLHTLKNALRKYAKEKPQSWVETVGMKE